MLFLTWEKAVSMLKGDAAAINMVGSERMRSFKIALLAERYAEGVEQDSGAKIRAKAAFDEEMAVFEDVLFGLRDGSQQYNLKKQDSPEIINKLNQNIDKWNKTIKPMLQNIVSVPTGKELTKALKG
ncbi:MAG: type IV pili methyl-accepting chemotaxis transducer N-terminal domain-containing protein, partial [Deltaproteobacteria bacterium]|nr:type IV pili methyl-accepting chemotaxis transducer N-terminal domain-containing protein [Deltaproteobacteria bacterium]